MKTKKNKSGITLIELIVVVAIIAMMAAAVYVVRAPAEKKGSIELTQSTIELLCAALEQYHSFYGKFPFDADENYNKDDLETDIGSTITIAGTDDYEPNYSSSEALYYFLDKVPDAKKIIDSINGKSLTNKGKRGGKYSVIVNGTGYPLIRIVDAWGNALRYTCFYDTNKKRWDNFPLITSAGPDGNFGDTDSKYKKDNITSRK